MHTPAYAPPPGAAPDLAAIYDAEEAFVWETLRRLGVRDGDLGDVTHDLFLALQRHLAEYDPARPLRPWLFAFAYRVASDYRRSARVRREVLELPADAPAAADGAGPASAKEARDLILTALEQVGLPARAVFVMHDLDGFTVPEIAEALGEPVNTLYSRLRVARAQFTAAVRRIRAEGEP